MSTSNIRVKKIRPLIPPAILLEEIPASPTVLDFVKTRRGECAKIVKGEDDRLIVVVGPCSIHDVHAAKEYAAKLADLAKELEQELLVVMRVYFEKPRTTVGWKGLINDPHLDESYDINRGLHIARQLLVDVNNLGLPVGCEMLDTISPQFIADLITWGAIGARTTESQLHRELVSGLSFPVGFKNGSSGSVQIAADAMVSASIPHSFLGVSSQGLAAIVETAGNNISHLILRGANKGPNYSPVEVELATRITEKALGGSRKACVMIDCSHGNSGKDHRKQSLVLDSVCSQIAHGNSSIIGVMIESFLVEGAQKLSVGKENLVYGKSITDKCVDFSQAERMLRKLAAVVVARRNELAPVPTSSLTAKL